MKAEDYIGNGKVTLGTLLAIPFRRMPIQAIGIGLLTIADGVALPLQVQVTSRLINQAIQCVSDGISKEVICSMITFCLILGYQWISRDIKKLLNIRVSLSVEEYCEQFCIRKITRLRYDHIENQDSWNVISRVKEHLTISVNSLFEYVFRFISLIMNVAGVLAIIFTQVWWAVIVIVCVMIPLVLLVRKSAVQTYQGEIEISDYTRRADDIKDTFTGNRLVEERCFFGFGPYLNERYQKFCEKLEEIRFREKRKWFVRMKAGSVVSSFGFAAILLAFVPSILSGSITIGFFSSISYAIFSMIQRLSWELTLYVDRITTVHVFCKDLNQFLKMEEDDTACCEAKESTNVLKSLEFSHVSFRYPGTTHDVLNDVSFRLEEKKCYAFVGENGSGKTTIMKLISGLYDNYTGVIKINGVDRKDYKAGELRGMIHTLFQDFARYPISIRDNILIGDICSIHENAEKMNTALEAFDLKDFVEGLPKGEETTVGRIEEGSVELSGGQWQRISIMRAFVNRASLKILDEPTAALDPISESRLYQQFKSLMSDHTTILISHRLGATKLADQIFVLGQGRIVEAGTHEQLINLGGVYDSMYQKQKEWYA